MRRINFKMDDVVMNGFQHINDELGRQTVSRGWRPCHQTKKNYESVMLKRSVIWKGQMP